MLTRPAFKQSIHVQVVAGDGVYLLSERGHHVLEGDVFEHVVPWLDGTHTVEDIVERLAQDLAPEQVIFALLELEKGGYVTGASDRVPRRSATYWEARGIDPALASDRLARTVVTVTVLGGVPFGTCVSVLTRHGLRVAGDGDVTVVVADNYLHSQLEDVNRRFLRERRCWVLVKPNGIVPWIGPVFDPDATGCWQCLEQRLRGNQPVEELVRMRTGSAELPNVFRGALDTTIETTFSMLAMYLVNWIGTGGASPLAGALAALDTERGTLALHPAPHRPQCPSCGDPALYGRRGREPIKLESHAKRFTSDGGYRVIDPAATVCRFEQCVDAITGVVRDVRKISIGEGAPGHLYVATHAGPALSHPRAVLMGIAGHQGAGGKGKTDVQARASALGEAIERASGVFQGDEPRIRGSFSQLRDDAIHPNRCMLFSEAQYRARSAGHAHRSNFNTVPVAFDESAQIEWTPVWSMTERRPRYLPTMYLYYAYPAEPEQLSCPSDSNGNASGNTREEAILQGFFELIERDAVGVWWYNRLRRPAVALDAVDDPYLQDLRAYYRTVGRDLWVLDLTSDLGIPVFASVSRRTDGRSEQILMGFGAHFDAAIAFGRAVTELSQMLAYGNAAEEGGDNLHPDIQAWLTTATVGEQPYLLPLPGGDHRLADYARESRPDLRDDVLAAQTIVEAAGLEMLVLDQTRPDLSIPVTKVIVPGLRHFWARLGPGRLYDVPVTMGWLPEARTEDDLNPIPMFF